VFNNFRKSAENICTVGRHSSFECGMNKSVNIHSKERQKGNKKLLKIAPQKY
jgi:hypothetical protein